MKKRYFLGHAFTCRTLYAGEKTANFWSICRKPFYRLSYLS